MNSDIFKKKNNCDYITCLHGLKFSAKIAIRRNNGNYHSRGELVLCGIFGFIMRKPVPLSKVFSILEKLEVAQYSNEDKPLGGYGAGIAVMLPDGDIISEKVGKTVDSPAKQLEQIFKNEKFMGTKLEHGSVLLWHVRNPTSEFMKNTAFKEAAQPYVEHFQRETNPVSPGDSYAVVSAHNGYVKNYLELKKKLSAHVFESEKVGLVDSEVIPHYFGEILNEARNVDDALYRLLSDLQGSNFAALLLVDKEDAFIHLIHKGKTRGLTVWANDKDEVIFCSRPEPVEEELQTALTKGKFKQKVGIKWQEDAGLKMSFHVML